MNLPKFFKSQEAYLEYRKAWSTRCARRESLSLGYQLFHRFLLEKSMAPSITKKTCGRTISLAFSEIYHPHLKSCYQDIQKWPEYNDWFNKEAIQAHMYYFYPIWDRFYIPWKDVKDLSALLENKYLPKTN